MDKKRKVYAPFSQTSEAGVTQTPVEGYIDVNQTIYPTVNTGVVNEKGQWSGVKSDDDEFFAITKNVAVANGGNTLNPATANIPSLDMTGFRHLFVAIKPSNGGNYAFTAVMGPDTTRYANLSPVAAGDALANNYDAGPKNQFVNAFADSNQPCTADAWNVFPIYDALEGLKNLQMRITNNSGGESTFEVAFMRLV